MGCQSASRRDTLFRLFSLIYNNRIGPTNVIRIDNSVEAALNQNAAGVGQGVSYISSGLAKSVGVRSGSYDHGLRGISTLGVKHNG